MSGKEIWISPSDLEDAELCLRKHWYKKVAKVPEVMKGSTTFGTVLHGVVERYLRADDLGRDPDGNPVDLYPPGWEIATERDGRTDSINPLEQSLVKKLVDAAIEEGILVRTPGREIEWKWNFPAPELEGVVRLNGKIDVLLPGGAVDDHKTSKSMRYAKGKAELKRSIQMVLYSMAAEIRGFQRGEPPIETFTLSHNVYCKDPDDLRVRRTSATLTRPEVDSTYTSRILPLMRRMVKVREVDKWHQVDPPLDMAKACNAFGGCSFASICNGTEAIENYRKRLASSPGARLNLPYQAATKPEPVLKDNVKENARMGVMDKMKASLGLAPAGAPAAAPSAPVNRGPTAPRTPAPAAAPAAKAPAAAPAKPAAPKAAPAAAPAPAAGGPPSDYVTPPWADPGCVACSKGPHPGWNSKGSPCPICGMNNKKAGRPTPSWFNIAGDHTGAAWEVKPEYAEAYAPFDPENGSAGTSSLPATSDVGTEVREELPTEPEPVAPSTSPEIPPLQQRKAGRPPLGFTMLCGCVIERTSKKDETFYFDRIYRETTEQIAKDGNQPYFTLLDAFKRREILAAYAGEIAASLGTGVLVCGNVSGPDELTLLNSLKQHAGTVISSVAY